MSTGTVTCAKCSTPLPAGLINQPVLIPCPACQARLITQVFPAFFKSPTPGRAGETILTEGEASCFYHPSKRAALPCDQCGRYLCHLCDLEMMGRHLCPNCVNSPRQGAIMPVLENRRVLYDSAALTVALLPILVWPLTLFTAPVAAGLAIYSFKKKSSLIPRTRLRAWLALALALLEIAAWAMAFFFI